ncbi:MAG: hypothetical protein ACYCYM_07740 [Saccharofermentanales bacterium]
MMINHRRLFIIFLIFLLALTNQVHGFVSARLTNTAAMKISPSSDALIGIPESLELTLSTADPELMALSDASAADITIVDSNFAIINNLAQTIDVFVTDDCDALVFDDLSIFSGETGKVGIRIIGPVSCGTVGLAIHIRWDDGSAVIYQSMVIKEN